jgi:hypothetical protein
MFRSLQFIVLIFVFAMYTLASSLHVANQREGGLPINTQESGYYFAELDVASAGIMSAAEGPTWSLGSNKTLVVWHTGHGAYAILQQRHRQIIARYKQYLHSYINAEIGLRKADLIFPFHYFW